MIINARQPVKLTPRSDWSPEQFRKTIYSQGLRVRWQQSARCPCSDTQTGFSTTLSGAGARRNRADCPACEGRGYLYHSAQEIRAIVTGARKADERFSKLGGSEYADGEAGFSFLPEHLPALGDRLTLLDSEIIYRETLTRGEGDTDRLTYPATPRAHDLESGLVSFSVRYCRAADLSGEIAPQLYNEGQHFTTSGASLTWIDTPPPTGARVSISYYTHPAFIVLDTPRAVRDGFRAFKAPEPYPVTLPIHARAALEQLGSPRGEEG